MDFITDDFMRSLPDEPRDAFLAFERSARDWLNQELSSMDENEIGTYYTLKYMNAVITAARRYEIGGIAEWPFGQPASHSLSDYRRFLSEIEVCTLELRFQRVQHAKQNSVALDPATKLRLTHWVQQMRESVVKADLPIEKKERLLGLINQLQHEIDLDRTPLQTIGEWWIAACGYFAQGCKKLGPAIRAAEQIGSALGIAKAEQETPAPKQLEGPKSKKLGSPQEKKKVRKSSPSSNRIDAVVAEKTRS